MDRTDLEIFTRLLYDPFRSDESLAREVSLTGKAVRLRRKRMETAGVLTEYGIHPHPELLGRHSIRRAYVGADPSPQLLSRLSKIEDLVYLRSFRPSFHIAVRFTKKPDAPEDPRLVQSLGRPIEGPLEDQLLSPALHADDLSRNDWKVLEAIVAAPRASTSTQARSAGVLPKTFRAHEKKLAAANGLRCAMILNLEGEAGVATYGIWLKVDESFDAKAVQLPRLWDRPHWTRNPRGVYLLGSADNYFEARELELRLQSLRGVLSAEPLLPAGGFFLRERLIGWIRAERELRWRTS
jgi:DNA-binding Lrp family transcriptional regulator